MMAFLRNLSFSSSHEQDTTEDEEDLMPKERTENRDARIEHSKLRRSIAAWSFCLACFVIGFVVAYFIFGRQNDKDKPLSPVPSMPMVPIMFERDERFAGPLSPENDQAWGSLTPPGDGFIFLKNSQKYDLPPGQEVPHGEIYDISLFHQLHCLAGIRAQFYLLQESIGRNNSQEIQETMLKPQEDHVHHCFDYIRQALMCAGDMTVEWPRTEKDGRRFAFDGWGIIHQCKSWDAIMTFMKENDVHKSLEY